MDGRRTRGVDPEGDRVPGLVVMGTQRRGAGGVNQVGSGRSRETPRGRNQKGRVPEPTACAVRHAPSIGRAGKPHEKAPNRREVKPETVTETIALVA